MSVVRLLMVSCFVLSVAMSPSALAHTDPPVMKLMMAPGRPTQGEAVHVKLTLTGAHTGIPILGAKIALIITDTAGTTRRYSAEPGPRAGEYRSTVVFPQPGLWKMRIEIAHLNEVDAREYPIEVTAIPSAHRQALTDEVRLFQHKMARGQPVPPQVLLVSFVLFVFLLLGGILFIRNLQAPRTQRSKEQKD